MNNDNISGADIRAEIHKTIDEIVQRGAQRLLAVALEAEVASYLARHNAKDEEGKATVVRNGYAKERTIASGAGDTECEREEGCIEKGGGEVGWKCALSANCTTTTNSQACQGREGRPARRLDDARRYSQH